jgi:hypothetical protein
MLKKLDIGLIILLLIIIISSSVIYLDFSNQKNMNIEELENIEIKFETKEFEGTEIINLSALSYSDVTYIDLTISAENHGKRDVTLINPTINLFLEDIIVVKKELDDLGLSQGTRELIRLEGLTFRTESVNEALKGPIERPETVLDFSGEISFEYNFRIGPFKLKTYRLSNNLEGKILLREIFGGKTQEEAAEEILGFDTTI